LPASLNTIDLARLFQGVVPEQSIISDGVALRVYECDGLTAFRQVPKLVLLPENTEQVRTVMAICQKHAIPIVGRGAGTSLSGGALPHKDGIVLSLAKMNQVLEIDTENRVARVQPGVTNLAISQAVQHLG